MKPSVVKLVDVILRELQDHPESPPTEHGLRKFLAGQGYNARDIEAAITLIRPRIAKTVNVLEHRPNVRVFSEYEEFKLTKEAKAALARLVLYHLIDQYELETILEGLPQFEGEVGLEELDYLLSWVVLGGRDVGNQQTIYDVFDAKGEVTRH